MIIIKLFFLVALLAVGFGLWYLGARFFGKIGKKANDFHEKQFKDSDK